LRNVLVISEMALAVVLLVSAGLMLKSLNRVLSTDPGFNTRNLLTGIVALPGNKYPDGPKTVGFPAAAPGKNQQPSRSGAGRGSYDRADVLQRQHLAL